MNAVARLRLPSLVAILALVWIVGCGSSDDGGGDGGTPFPAGAGIQQNVSVVALQSFGWTVCHEDTYASYGTAISSILAGCQGTYMMLACGRTDTPDRVTLAAADLRSVVTQADAEGLETHHVSNGVGWYFTATQSWGFFPAGQGVNRDTCDTDAGSQTAKELRMCWNADAAGAILNGYRCGDNSLNDASWRRLVLVH